MTTKLHVHHLEGCSPTPLSHYLKALGILRLVAAQADPSARGWWQGRRFLLGCTLDEAELEQFFLTEYNPTPILAPWNGGSGFYPKDKKDALDAIAASLSSRFAAYRHAIEVARPLCKGLDAAYKDERKADLVRSCRDGWHGAAAEWLDAAVILLPEAELKYPALLGTGGNDGRLDFSNNFMQRLAGLFELTDDSAKPGPEAGLLLRSALWGTSTNHLSASAIGQFHPAGAGGANSTNGFSGDPLINPWDFILMLEGTILFACSAVRLSETDSVIQAAAPFAVFGAPAGYGSAATSGDKNRGEQWMPLWGKPATANEIQDLLLEGRSRVGRRMATRAVDFARSVGRLGVARGISAFERFGFIERNGQANLAAPLGTWIVSPQPNQDLLDDIAPWLNQLERASRDKLAPARFASTTRRCHEAVMACCHDAGGSANWQHLLRELGRAERLALHSPRFAAGKGLQPLPRLRRGWLRAIDDGSPEVRVAAALGSAVVREHSALRMQSIRMYWLPLLPGTKQARFMTGTDSIAATPQQVCHGLDLVADCTSLLQRRAVEATQEGHTDLGVISKAGFGADLGSIAAMTAGTFADTRCIELAQPLMALDWNAVRDEAITLSVESSHDGFSLGAVFGILRLAMPLEQLPAKGLQDLGLTPARFEAAALRWLAAGNLPAALQVALRRVRSCGGHPKLRLAASNPTAARRVAAALAVPLSPSAAFRLAEMTLKPAQANRPSAVQQTLP